MNVLKARILRVIQIDLDKDDHLAIMKKKEEERRERDAKIGRGEGA